METKRGFWSIKTFGLTALTLALAQPMVRARTADQGTSAVEREPPGSPAAITKAVQAALQGDPDMRSVDIIAAADGNGKVTLIGTVSTQAQKDRASAIIEGVSGVTSVDNRLSLATAPASQSPATTKQEARETGQEVSDDWITTKVKSQLVATGSPVHVTTVNHVVTLTGTVSTRTERMKAASIAKTTDGVTKVVDEVKVVPAK